MRLLCVNGGLGALALASFLAACGGASGTSLGDDSDSGASSDGGGTDGGQPDATSATVDGSGGDAGATDTSTGDSATDGTGAGGHDGSALDGGTDAESDAPFATAAHAPLPQVINFNGDGGVLATPKVQLIVYAEDPMESDIDKMATELTQTTTWSEQTSEYGVGPLTKLPTIQIAGIPPATLDDNTGTVTPFERTLVTNTSGANPVWGAADPSTIYMFLLPKGTNINEGGSCCTDFLGYHWEVPVGSLNISYAISCDCGVVANFPLTALEWVTTTVSHELAESATDPHPNTDPAFSTTDNDDYIWTYATGGEVADMCEYNTDSNYTPPGSTYMVQRSWSDQAAAAGTNPCVPVPPTGPYFDAMPVLTDVTLQGMATKGVTIPVGSSKTIDVQLFSAAPTAGPFTVVAYDLNEYLGNTANTTVSLDKTTGSNGDVLHLTITVKNADSVLGGEGFVLETDLNGQQNLAFGAIVN